MDVFFVQLLSSPVTGWGAFGALAIFVVYMVIRGTFIPRRTHEREMAQEKVRGDEWKETALEYRKQWPDFAETTRIVRDFFRKVSVDSPKTGDNTPEEVH